MFSKCFNDSLKTHQTIFEVKVYLVKVSKQRKKLALSIYPNSN